MATAADPIIAIIGNVRTDPDAPAAAETLGRELAKAGLRIPVYSSGADYPEGWIVRGYVASRLGGRCSVQVRYPLHAQKPAFLEQQTNAEVFDWRLDYSQDWEMSFYQSINEVDGVLPMGGGDSTMIGGIVAMGHRIAMLPLAQFGGAMTITAQISTAPASGGRIVSVEHASRLVPFGVHIGFIAGLRLDAVFHKLIASDVVDVSVVERKRP